jgi:hypothetical protein
LPEIIHLLGSFLPISEITFYFRTLGPHFLPINVNDFVSAFQENHNTLSSLTLYAVRQVLDLDSLSSDEEPHTDDEFTTHKVQSNSRLRDRAKQLAQLTRLLHARLPQLREVEFIEHAPRRIGDDLAVNWKFSVSGDGRVILTLY